MEAINYGPTNIKLIHKIDYDSLDRFHFMLLLKYNLRESYVVNIPTEYRPFIIEQLYNCHLFCNFVAN